jgi:hypothetical protein
VGEEEKRGPAVCTGGERGFEKGGMSCMCGCKGLLCGDECVRS